jgi:HPt (histidine-containing phosphotransfer) domain-containing protein
MQNPAASRYSEHCVSTSAEIRAAIAQCDSEKLHRAAHALKGAVGSLCAQAASETALQLERMGRAGELTEAELALRALEREMERLKPALLGLAGEVAGD